MVYFKKKIQALGLLKEYSALLLGYIYDNLTYYYYFYNYNKFYFFIRLF